MHEYMIIWKDQYGNKHTWKAERETLEQAKWDVTYWPDFKEIVEIWERVA